MRLNNKKERRRKGAVGLNKDWLTTTPADPPQPKRYPTLEDVRVDRHFESKSAFPWMDSSYENKINWDMKEPCAECPFKCSTPIDRKGLLDENKILSFSEGLHNGQIAHTCHQTDPRSDCESAQNYTGALQHCMGFAIMAEKSNMVTNPMWRALGRGNLKVEQLKDPENKVHSWKDLCKVIYNYCLEGLRE